MQTAPCSSLRRGLLKCLALQPSWGLQGKARTAAGHRGCQVPSRQRDAVSRLQGTLQPAPLPAHFWYWDLMLTMPMLIISCLSVVRCRACYVFNLWWYANKPQPCATYLRNIFVLACPLWHHKSAKLAAFTIYGIMNTFITP